MGRTERFYKLELLLRSRGCVSFAALQAELGVSPATLKRDLQYLRDRLSAPITYDATHNGYRFSAAKAGAGDPRAIALIQRAEAALGNLAVGIVNALNPERIVVGGSVAEHEPSHVLDPMRRAIAGRAFKVPAAAVSVVPSALGGDVSIVGSALAARDRAAGRGEWFL